MTTAKHVDVPPMGRSPSATSPSEGGDCGEEEADRRVKRSKRPCGSLLMKMTMEGQYHDPHWSAYHFRYDSKREDQRMTWLLTGCYTVLLSMLCELLNGLIGTAMKRKRANTTRL